MPYGVVQTVSGTVTSGNPVSVAATSSSNTLVLGFAYGSVLSITSVLATGITWLQRSGTGANSPLGAAYYDSIVAGASITSFTITLSAGSEVDYIFREYSGVAGPARTAPGAWGSGTSTSLLSGATGTGTLGDLVVGFGAVVTNADTVTAGLPSSHFVYNTAGATYGVAMEDGLASSALAQTATMNVTVGPKWLMQCMAYEGVGALTQGVGNFFGSWYSAGSPLPQLLSSSSYSNG